MERTHFHSEGAKTGARFLVSLRADTITYSLSSEERMEMDKQHYDHWDRQNEILLNTARVGTVSAPYLHASKPGLGFRCQDVALSGGSETPRGRLFRNRTWGSCTS